MTTLIDSPRLEITYISPYTDEVIIMSPEVVANFKYRSWDEIKDEFYIQYGVFDFIVEGGVKLNQFLNQINKPIYQ